MSDRENRVELYPTLAQRAGIDLPPRACWLLYRLADQPACTVNDVAQRLKVGADLIQPGVDGLLAAGMIEERRRGVDCDLYLTAAGTAALEKLTEARRGGLTELLDGWNPEEHPEIIAMVKDLAHSLLADDERLVADAMPHVPAGVSGGGRRRLLTSLSGAGRRFGSGLLAAPDAARPGRPVAPPSASSPMSAAPRTGGASRRTRTACGAVAWMPCATRPMEGRVGRVEDPAPEHDLHGLVLDVEADDGGADERGDLVGQEVGRLAGGGVTFGGRVEEDPGQLEEPGVGERAAVDARERGLGVGRAELRGHPFTQRGGGAPAVAGPQSEAEGAQAEPGAARGEVPRQLGQGREADGAPVRADGGAVHSRPAHDADAPTAVVPARDTAKVSLRRMTRSVHPSTSMAGASFSSSTGRSRPARQ